MKALGPEEGRGSNPYYDGNFDGESDELRDLRLSLVAERDALKATFEHTLAECRDAYPVPEVGSELEGLWGQAIGDPASVGAYVSACATSQKKEIDELKAENERLTNCLKKANDQAEDFERRWYLVDMELERIRALPPVAWEVYVADADNAYVVESLDDPQLIDDCTNSDAVVTPLIALGSKT